MSTAGVALATIKRYCCAMSERFYPVGEPGRPWTDDDKSQWRARQVERRSHAEVVSRIDALAASGRFALDEYGRVDAHALLALRTRAWRDSLPVVIVTGGVHGYETSGVHGALAFAEGADVYDGRVNLVVVPCVSPWAYERVQRWNAAAIDPNRSFKAGGTAAESLALMAFVEPWRDTALLHIDLHETTDSDESEFRPAVAARDGKPFTQGSIPDGFYLVADAENPQPSFQRAIIEAVSAVTHIAPADARGEIIGCPVTAPGIIALAVRSMGLCAGMTRARFSTTTEVYPDSPKATPPVCNAAQVVAVQAAIDFALRSA